MTLQAPAIIDVRPGGIGASEMVAWLRGIGVRQVRIACGLIMFSYIFSHFFNHALGNISYATMERMVMVPPLVVANSDRQFHALRRGCDAFVARPVGALPAPAFSLHGRRDRATRVGLQRSAFAGQSFRRCSALRLRIRRDPNQYATPLFAYWGLRPYMIAVQFVLLLVAWTHACIGLYFWLRLKPFFKWAGPILLAVAVLLPPLAMAARHHGARREQDRPSPFEKRLQPQPEIEADAGVRPRHEQQHELHRDHVRPWPQ